MREVIERFAAKLPNTPTVKTHKKAEPFPVAKELAMGYPLIEFNHPTCDRWWAFDVDKPMAVLAWENIDLRPNLVVVNPANTYAHLIYELALPLERPDELWRHVCQWGAKIRNAIIRGLGADVGYCAKWCKTPGHVDWQTHSFRSTPYTFDEFTSHLDLKSGPPPVEDQGGRNTTLYRKMVRARRRYSETEWRDIAERLTAEQNESLFQLHPRGPLPFSEVKSIARSVIKPYRRRGRSRTVDISEEDRARCRLGQERGAVVKRERSLRKISDAYVAVLRDGLDPTQEIVAKRADRGLRTVKRYWEEILGRVAGTPHSDADLVVQQDGGEEVQGTASPQSFPVLNGTILNYPSPSLCG